jgi:DNA-binding NarL/FixJ family response regulator
MLLAQYLPRNGRLGSHLSWAHPRRGRDFVSTGHGDVTREESFRALHAIGYTGPIWVEWEDAGTDACVARRRRCASFGISSSSRQWSRSTRHSPAMTAIDAGRSLESEPTAETKQLLTLMAIGATDRAVARELGLSERTVHRRTARLQVLLGAQSRFQLGVLVSVKQWL